MFQQTVFNRFILDVRYLGVKGVHLPVQDTLNISSGITAAQHLPLYYSAPTLAQLNALPNTLTSLQHLSTNSLASSGFTNPIYTVRPDGQSWYNGLLVTGTQRFSGGLQMKANYTWSHLLDDMAFSGANFATVRTDARPRSTITGMRALSPLSGTSAASAPRASTGSATCSRTSPSREAIPINRLRRFPC